MVGRRQPRWMDTSMRTDRASPFAPRLLHRRLVPLLLVGWILFPSGMVGCSSSSAECGLDLSRYPRRVPEWLWQEPRYQGLIPRSVRSALDGDLKQLESMRTFEETPAVLRKERAVARKLAAVFSVTDLAEGAHVVTDPRRGLSLAVQIDPAFDEQARRTLIEASELFVRHALDEGVIGRAMAAGASRGGPRDAAALRAHLSDALSARSGEPALLVISLYRGNAWWGGAKLNFFHDRTYHLARVPPPRGYLYIRLNADKLRAGEPHGRDPAFWAGKIGHEVLHNLGYSHPRYASPAERDERNTGSGKAFVVAYELELGRRRSGGNSGPAAQRSRKAG